MLFARKIAREGRANTLPDFQCQERLRARSAVETNRSAKPIQNLAILLDALRDAIVRTRRARTPRARQTSSTRVRRPRFAASIVERAFGNAVSVWVDF
jgi:hypothetical protein